MDKIDRQLAKEANASQKYYEETQEAPRKKKMASVRKTIIAGKIYAQIVSGSNSGGSRQIMFFRVKNGRIENVTAEIAWLTGWVKFGEYKQEDNFLNEDGLSVKGCGMDMILHTLLTALHDYTSLKWNQRYRRL